MYVYSSTHQGRHSKSCSRSRSPAHDVVNLLPDAVHVLFLLGLILLGAATRLDLCHLALTVFDALAHVVHVCGSAPGLVLEVGQLPLHPLLSKRNGVHFLLQLVPEDGGGVLAGVRVLLQLALNHLVLQGSKFVIVFTQENMCTAKKNKNLVASTKSCTICIKNKSKKGFIQLIGKENELASLSSNVVLQLIDLIVEFGNRL
jgi:hypothetical protein